MASFCTKCGAALSPDKQFCTACGAPVGSAAVPRVPVPPPVYGQPAGVPAQPAGSGNTALKIILIVVGSVVGLCVIGVIIVTFGVWRMSRAIHANRNGGVTVSTPTGTITTGGTGAVSEADLGVAIYPGATRQEGGMQINSGSGSMVTVVYSTPDSLNKVIDFYKSKLGESSSVIQTGTGAVITSASQNSAGENNESMVITLTSDPDGQTKIAIMRTRRK